MSHLCIIHSEDGAPWAEYATAKLLRAYPEIKIASLPDHKAFSNFTRNDPSIPDSDVVILIASPDLLDFLNTHTDVVFNTTIDRYVKHCLILLLGLEKQEMDEKYDHFPLYDKWKHMTLTEEQDDLVLLFQGIIEIMQEVIDSRNNSPKSKSPVPKERTGPKKPPKPKPKPKPVIEKQPHVEIASGDELDEIVHKTVPDSRSKASQEEPAGAKTVVPGHRQKSTDGSTSSENASLGISINVEPSTPQNEGDTEPTAHSEDPEYCRQIDVVTGSALDKSDTEQSTRETDTDMNDNKVPPAGKDDVDGPFIPDCGVAAVRFGRPHRPRSEKVEAIELKRFRNKSEALRFTLSPPVIDGDVSPTFTSQLRFKHEVQVHDDMKMSRTWFVELRVAVAAV